MIELRRLHALPHDALAPLLAESAAEGFRFLPRLVQEWEEGRERYAAPGAALLAAFEGSLLEGSALLAIGGLTPDPYSGDPAVGRLRHLYVCRAARRRGLGRQLVQALEELARAQYRVLVLRTDTLAAARFYEALGYHALPSGGTATHQRLLGPPVGGL